jgi:rhodanese-related sulfurtransferase
MLSDHTPEITVEQLADKLRSADQFVLLDVRESWELERARITDDRLAVVPVSRLGREGIDALPLSARALGTEIFVLCHQGVRSANVTSWLAAQGWTNVFSVSGGIDRYARQIDPKVGNY